jgi:hypothetical protein
MIRHKPDNCGAIVIKSSKKSRNDIKKFILQNQTTTGQEGGGVKGSN